MVIQGIQLILVLQITVLKYIIPTKMIWIKME